jgi:23S rRNA pseudouridine1911/1915/1917 synthase
MELNSFFVTDDEAGERLDKLLFQHYKGEQSRTYFQYLINDGHVLVNGAIVKKRCKPNAQDQIEVEFTITPEIDLKAEDIPLDILFEDEHFLAVNKPVGMVVHPAPGHWTGTFVNALLGYCKSLSEEEFTTLRPGIVHRLDKETSGVLIAAKNTSVQQGLQELFAKREIRKEYIAICLGNPGTGTINAPIQRHPHKRKEMCIAKEGGRSAVTHFETLKTFGRLSLIKLRLETGRTHQIRIHMKYRGTPILGDSIYGQDTANKRHGVHRQMLHAYRLEFTHPVTGEPCKFEAPCPHDMSILIDKIK